jgi:hypothetical protein
VSAVEVNIGCGVLVGRQRAVEVEIAPLVGERIACVEGAARVGEGLRLTSTRVFCAAASWSSLETTDSLPARASTPHPHKPGRSDRMIQKQVNDFCIESYAGKKGANI